MYQYKKVYFPVLSSFISISQALGS